MIARRKNRRKRYIIDVGFQLKYIGYFLLFLYAGAAIAGYTVYYTTWMTLGEKLANVYPTSRLVYILRDGNIILLLRLLLITPLIILVGIILSHRIVGPAYRIGKYIDSLRAGDYSQGLTLRKRDALKELALRLTQLCYKLREDTEKRNKTVEDLVGSLKKKNLTPEILEEIRTKLKVL